MGLHPSIPPLPQPFSRASICSVLTPLFPLQLSLKLSEALALGPAPTSPQFYFNHLYFLFDIPATVQCCFFFIKIE